MKKNVKKSLIAAATTLSVAVVGVAAFTYSNVYRATGAVYQKSGADKERSSKTLINKNKPVSMLVMGSNSDISSKTPQGETSSMMLMTLNPTKKTTTVTSISPDLKVKLPDYKKYSPAKISSAYQYGGTKEAIETVQNTLKTPVDYYTLFNVEGLTKTVDSIGGINVKAPESFTSAGAEFNKGQTYHLDGNEAVKFIRDEQESTKNDKQVQHRQELVMEKAMNKAMSLKTLFNKEFLDSVSGQLRTDLTRSQMAKLSTNYRQAGNKVIESDPKTAQKEIGGEKFDVMSKKASVKTANSLHKNLGLKKISK